MICGEGLFLGLLQAGVRERQPLLILIERLLITLLVYARLHAKVAAEQMNTLMIHDRARYIITLMEASDLTFKDAQSPECVGLSRKA